MSTKTILVTGALGYIGSHAVVELLKRGYEVVGIDNLSNSRLFIKEQIKKICGRDFTFYQEDINSAGVLEKVFKQHPHISSVIHFAAYKSVSESVENPLKYYENNINGIINLLKLQHKHPFSLVFSSSCTVYGIPEKVPVTETSPIQPAFSPYGNTKQIGEEILRDYSRSNKNFKCVSLRYFNPVGADDSGLIGELPLGTPQNLVPYLTQTAVGKHKELTIFGDDYHTEDGTCIRDFIHVTDLVDAHIIAVEKIFEGKIENNFEVYNIGTGRGTSVLEFVQNFEKVTGIKLPYKIGKRRAGDVAEIWADTSLSKEKLNWTAKRNIENMIETAWQWELNLKNLINE